MTIISMIVAPNDSMTSHKISYISVWHLLGELPPRIPGILRK